MSVDTGLANAQLGVVNDALHLVHAVHDGLAWTDKFHPAAECGDAAVMNAFRLFVRLTKAECALDVSEVSADFWMNLAGYKIFRLHLPRCRKPKWMREGI